MHRSITAAVTLLALLVPPAAGQDGEGPSFAPIIGPSLTERFWVRQEGETGLPGSMMLFLSEGTMIQTSCWEGYRLSNWHMLSETELSWEEDTMTIAAEIVELDEAQLVLALDLVDGIEILRFGPAPVPYVCPDMPV